MASVTRRGFIRSAVVLGTAAALGVVGCKQQKPKGLTQAQYRARCDQELKAEQEKLTACNKQVAAKAKTIEIQQAKIKKLENKPPCPAPKPEIIFQKPCKIPLGKKGKTAQVSYQVVVKGAKGLPKSPTFSLEFRLPGQTAADPTVTASNVTLSGPNQYGVSTLSASVAIDQNAPAGKKNLRTVTVKLQKIEIGKRDNMFKISAGGRRRSGLDTGNIPGL